MEGKWGCARTKNGNLGWPRDENSSWGSASIKMEKLVELNRKMRRAATNAKTVNETLYGKRITYLRTF